MEGMTDIRRVMDRVTRHPMMRDLPFETAVEWAVDFIQLMGAPSLLEERTAAVEVRDWRGELPCDCESIVQVRDMPDGCRPGLAWRYSGDSFHMSPHPRPGRSRTYKVQGRTMFASERDCELEVAYRAFAVDGEGLPLLPDEAAFLRGLEAYVKMQWFTVLFDEGKVSLAVLQNAQREYAWAAGAAQAHAHRLTPDKAETISNAMRSLLPRSREHMRGFYTNGAREEWRVH